MDNIDKFQEFTDELQDMIEAITDSEILDDGEKLTFLATLNVAFTKITKGYMDQYATTESQQDFEDSMIEALEFTYTEGQKLH